MVTCTDKGAVKPLAPRAPFLTTLPRRVGVMLCVLVLAPAADNPSTLSADVEEALTGALQCLAPRQKKSKLRRPSLQRNDL